MCSQLTIAFISSASALLGAIIGAGSTIFSVWYSKRLQSKGKVCLYAKIVHERSTGKNWGFYKDDKLKINDTILIIPVWLEVVNTCGIPRIVRDVNLYAYRKEFEIGKFTQIQSSKNKREEDKLANNESYTLVIPEKSAQRFRMEFILHKSQIEYTDKAFDRIHLKYYDEKNIRHTCKFVDIIGDWERRGLKVQEEFVSLIEDTNT